MRFLRGSSEEVILQAFAEAEKIPFPLAELKNFLGDLIVSDGD